MRVTYVNVRARHLLKKSMVRAPKNMAAIVFAIVMNLPGMSLQPLYWKRHVWVAIRALMVPNKPAASTYKQLTDALTAHLVPKPIVHVIAKRFRFRKQKGKQLSHTLP